MKTKLIFLVIFSCSVIANSQEPVVGGVTKTDVDTLRTISKAILPVSASGQMPYAIDFSENFPPVGSQCYSTSCVSYAASYQLLSYYKMKQNGWKYLDENGVFLKQTVFSPFYTHYFIKDCSQCFTCGSKMNSALKFLRNNGAVSLNLFELNPCDENNCNILPDSDLEIFAKENKLSSYAWIYSDESYSRAAPVSLLKRYLYQQIPVLILLEVTDDLRRQKNKPSTFVFKADHEPGIGLHALICTGYNDSLGAIKVINSWSSSWGFKGSIWIDYKLINKYIAEAYVANIDESYLTPGYLYFSSSIDSFSLTSASRGIKVKQFSGDFFKIDSFLIAAEAISNSSSLIKIIFSDKDGVEYMDKRMVNKFKPLEITVGEKKLLFDLRKINTGEGLINGERIKLKVRGME